MRRSAFIMTASALALFAGQAAAQDATPLRLGQSISGTLTAEDTTVDSEEVGQYVYDTYSIEAREGQRLEVVMRSEAFDAYLEAFEGSDDGDAIASDDDGLGEETDSRLRFSTDAGTYIIRARNLSGLDGGAYTIEVTDRGPGPRAPRPTAIRVGGNVDGEISDRDPVEEDAGEYSQYAYDGYVFRAREGERVAISLDSEDFDPMVRVGRIGRGGDFEQLAYNDDTSAGGLNSYLVFSAPSDGEYIVRAAPLDGSTEGEYALSLAEGPPPILARQVVVGETINGELTASDGSNDAGLRADAYTFTAAEGDRVVATMRSEAFDTYLELFSVGTDGVGRTSVDSDDDGAGEGTGSRLSYSITTAGEYTLEARAFSAEGEGDYTLTLEAGVPEPEPAELTYGATVQGEIVDEDPRDEESRGFDAYRFSGEEGNRVQVIMRSGDFDSYLQIGSPEGDFYALATDDDGLGEGTDSRLNYILPSTGEFILRTSPLYADADGLYSVELINKGPQPTAGSILVGATARGTLSDDDALADDSSFYDAYRITVKAGEKLRLVMVSNEFDSFIDIGREDDEGVFTSLVSDDDSLSDTHAKIDWAVEEEGDYIIRARSFSQGQTGAYALTVEPKD